MFDINEALKIELEKVALERDQAKKTAAKMEERLKSGALVQKVSLLGVGKSIPFGVCPRCPASLRCAGGFGEAGTKDGVPFKRDLGSRFTCTNGHTWEILTSGDLVLQPDPEPYEPEEHVPIPVFDEWATLNQIMCPDRSRFDVLREELPKCKTKAAVLRWLQVENFDRRYPILPELPE